VRKAGAYQPLIATPVSTGQIEEMVRGSELAALLPDRDTNGVPAQVRVLGRMYRVQAARRGDSIILKIEAGGGAEERTSAAFAAATAPAAPPADERRDLRRDERRPQPTPQAARDERRDERAGHRYDERASSAGSSLGRDDRTAERRDRIGPASSGHVGGPPLLTGPIPRLDDDDLDARGDGYRGDGYQVEQLGRAIAGASFAPSAALSSPSTSAAGSSPAFSAASAIAEGARDDESIDLELDLSPPVAQAPASAYSGDIAFDAAAAAPPRRAAAAPAAYAPPAHAAPAAYAPPAHAVHAVAAAPAPRLAPAGRRAVPPAFAALIRAARQHAATDLHLSPGQPPLLRAVGQLHRLGEPLDAAAVAALLEPCLTPDDRVALDHRGYVDLALDVPGERGAPGRLRANISRQRGGLKGSFRLVWEGVPTLELLGLPKDLARVTSYHQGLVVIAGPSGHGKTTTLAALVDLINSSKPHHILCVEDPVEVVHPRKMSVVSQREVGQHTLSFATALKASLREDPDVIVIGEVRDRETVEIALTAAETGHLVIVTMSTPSAAKTIDRLIDMFPPDDQPQVRISLAAALRFILAQRLLPRQAGDGVVPAVELLTGVLPVAALIRDNKLFQLPNLQQRGRAFGMIRFDDSILELIRSGAISEEAGLAVAENKREMHANLHPPDPAALAAAAAAQPRAWDDAKQRLGGLFKRGERDKDRE
jgi:twitching motility protein PilT